MWRSFQMEPKLWFFRRPFFERIWTKLVTLYSHWILKLALIEIMKNSCKKNTIGPSIKDQWLLFNLKHLIRNAQICKSHRFQDLLTYFKNPSIYMPLFATGKIKFVSYDSLTSVEQSKIYWGTGSIHLRQRKEKKSLASKRS